MITWLELDGQGRFKYWFKAIDALIWGWEHCRPIILVDDTYLNGHYSGILFTTCTQYANNSIFILTFKIGDNENDSSWLFFFFFLNWRKSMGIEKGCVLYSDCHNNINNTIKNVYSGTCHEICSYHLLQNLKSRYENLGYYIMQAFNSVVRSYTLSEYKYNLQ